MSEYRIRTDLAVEIDEDEEEWKEAGGVTYEEEYREESLITISRVRILTKKAAKRLKKPVGTYITIEAADLEEQDVDYHREVSEELAKVVREMKKKYVKEDGPVLVVGLGNHSVTPDALGPHVVDNLMITRHVLSEYGKNIYEKEVHSVGALAPGVMAQTGMEAVEIIKGVVQEISPALVIVIDALAARSTKRLNKTIQITDTGIHPGAGVGNNRSEITREVLGVPVIAIGVPTVVDAATIVADAIEHFEEMLPQLSKMYVTSKDVDENIKRIGFTISEALNIALHT